VPERLLFRQAIFVHALTWWGVRILSGRAAFMHVFDQGTAEWWAMRLARAVLTVVIVLAWARWLGVTPRDLGLGNRGFGRNALVAAGVTAVLWITIVGMRGSLTPPAPLDHGVRVLAAITGLVDVLAQQLSTFGLLQGLGARHLGSRRAFVLARFSFGLARMVIATPPVVLGALSAGILFGLLMWKTGNLGAGLGLHSAFYVLRVVFGWGA